MKLEEQSFPAKEIYIPLGDTEGLANAEAHGYELIGYDEVNFLLAYKAGESSKPCPPPFTQS
jgi:hypothetical protein